MHFILSVLSLASLSFALHIHSHGHEATEKRLPSQWYYREDHPVRSLFRRGANTDGYTYAAAGSKEWTSSFPDTADTKTMPKEWSDALNAAVKAGKIPNVPLSSQPQPDSNPVYPNNADPNAPNICSTTYQCRAEGVIYDAPDGIFATSFDDGPQPPTADLLNFLKTNNETTTHFMIGQNIKDLPDLFMQAFNQGDDIAVHTYTHPYMTTLSNLQVVAELGWTMEIIHNSTGGRVPKYWRPPYGDSDIRVVAIAKEVFGLTTIIWNQDTEDWSIPAGGTTPAKVQSQMTKWLTGPKSPGLIILEHELYNVTVAAFKAAYPLIAQNGWKMVPVTQLFDDKTPYQNAGTSLTDAVRAKGILAADVAASPSASASPPPSAGGSASSPSPSAKSNGSGPSSSSGAPSPSNSAKPSAALKLRGTTSLILSFLSVIVGVASLSL